MTCGKKAAPGQWYGFCGDSDMGCSPVYCVNCGGSLILENPDPKKAAAERAEYERKMLNEQGIELSRLSSVLYLAELEIAKLRQEKDKLLKQCKKLSDTVDMYKFSSSLRKS